MMVAQQLLDLAGQQSISNQRIAIAHLPRYLLSPLVFCRCYFAMRSDHYRKSHPCVLRLRPSSSVDAISQSLLCRLISRDDPMAYVCLRPLPKYRCDVHQRSQVTGSGLDVNVDHSISANAISSVGPDMTHHSFV